MRDTGSSKKVEQFLEEFEIRRLIENWVLWRDSGVDFDRFAGVWHPQGQIVVTWCQASASEFIARGKAGFEGGGKSLHMLGGSSIDISGSRAVAQTKCAIMVRGQVHGVEVDVTCYGRFFDLLEKLDDQWLLYFREPIYELDQMIPTAPGRLIELDADLLNSFPEGYRHMAYMFKQAGIAVLPNLPGVRGPEVEALYARGRAWLAGED